MWVPAIFTQKQYRSYGFTVYSCALYGLTEVVLCAGAYPGRRRQRLTLATRESVHRPRRQGVVSRCSAALSSPSSACTWLCLG